MAFGQKLQANNPARDESTKVSPQTCAALTSEIRPMCTKRTGKNTPWCVAWWPLTTDKIGQGREMKIWHLERLGFDAVFIHVCSLCFSVLHVLFLGVEPASWSKCDVLFDVCVSILI